MMKFVSHEQASQLLHNKFVVVLGDSIQRSVYKDLVLLLQREKYLSTQQLRSKGEMSFEQDCLVEGGCLSELHNGTEYREVRQFQSAHHLVRFYFVTRIHSHYMESIFKDLCQGLKPDLFIVNSCVWDISRYSPSWVVDYKSNLHRFFSVLSDTLLKETLVIWSLTMPLAERIKGGFLVPEIEHKAPQLRYDIIEANFYSATLADAYGMDVLDLHFQFRFSLQHRTKDGVHWNAIAHRRMTSLLLQHAAEAWGVVMPPVTADEKHTEISAKQPVCGNGTKPAAVRPSPLVSLTERRTTQRNHDSYREEFYSDSLPQSYWSFEDDNQYAHRHKPTRAFRHALPPVHRPTSRRTQAGYGFPDRPHHFEPYHQHHYQHVMRSRHRYHYAPYTQHRPTHPYFTHRYYN